MHIYDLDLNKFYIKFFFYVNMWYKHDLDLKKH